jgi:hypothetical protein
MQMILLKRHISQLPREVGRLLINCSSTFYAKSMVAQGQAAALAEGLRRLQDIAHFLSTLPSTRVANLLVQASLTLEEIQSLSESLGEFLSSLEDATR